MDGTNRRASPIAALAVMVVSISITIWLVGALTNEDLQWFLRTFDEQPVEVIIYRQGAQYCLTSSDPGFREVVEAFNTGIAHWGAYEGSVGLSQASLERMRQESWLLELHYDHPVQVHTQHLYPVATTFYVPLEGTHARWRRVFGGITEPHIGVLEMKEENFRRLVAAVEAAQSTARRCDGQ